MQAHKPIHQNAITANIEAFLKALGTNEKLPDWTANGMCEAFVFMMFRADLIGQQNVLLTRLQRIANTESSEMQQFAKWLAECKSLLSASSVSRNALFKEKIKACNGDKELIKKANAEHDKETNALKAHYLNHVVYKAAKEQLESTMPPIIAESPEKIKEIYDSEIAKRVAVIKEQLQFAEEFYIYIGTLLYSHDPSSIAFRNEKDHLVQRRDYVGKLSAVMPDALLPVVNDSKHGSVSPIREEFNFGFIFRQNELIKVLNLAVMEGDMVRLGSTDHVMYLTKKNGTLHVLYNANENTGNIDFSQTTALADKIRDGFFSDFSTQDQYMPINIKIFRKVQSAPVNRPLVKTLIDDIFKMRAPPVVAGVATPKNIGVEDQSWDEFTALMFAARCNDAVTVNDLIEERGANLDACTKHKSTALYIAADFGALEAAKIIINKLVERKKSVDQTGSGGWTPLCNAANAGHPEMCLALLQAGANPNHEADSGDTPLAMAVRTDSAETIKHLIKYGAVVTRRILTEALTNKSLLAAHPEGVLYLLFNFPDDVKIGSDFLTPYEKYRDLLFNGFKNKFEKGTLGEKIQWMKDIASCQVEIHNAFFKSHFKELIEMTVRHLPANILNFYVMPLVKTNFYGDALETLLNNMLLIAAENGNKPVYDVLVRNGASPEMPHTSGVKASALLAQKMAAGVAVGGIFKPAVNDSAVAPTSSAVSPKTPGSA